MRRFWTGLMVLMFLVAGSAEAQFFYDDFEDGDAHDGNPVTWEARHPVFGETRQVQDGSYILTPGPNTYVMADAPADRIYSDILLRTQMRFLVTPESFTAIGVSARGNEITIGGETNWSGYWACITTNGMLQIGRTMWGNVQVRTQVPFGPVPINTDLIIDFALSGDQLSLTAWHDGALRPSAPQLSLTDTNFSDGEVAIWVNNSINRVPGAFRYFAAVPEPGSFTLLLAILVGAVCLIHKRCRITV